MKKMQICLWFQRDGEEAARFYTSVFKDSKLGRITRYGNAGQEIHGGVPGSVLAVEFELNGISYMALNGGPFFKLSEAASIQVLCETQEEIDYYWDKLTPGGDPEAQQCGWLKDKFGLSWQITPSIVGDLLASDDQARADRVMNALFPMKKIDLAAILKAAEG